MHLEVSFLLWILVKGLIKYTLSIVLVLICTEVFVSQNHTYFKALSDKLLLKLEMLKKRGDDELVFIGSSKTLDAVDSELFNTTFNEKSSRKIKTFNMATTGQNKKRFFHTIKKVLNSQVKVLVIEVSYVNFIKGKLGFNELKEKLIKDSESQSFEEKFQSFLGSNLKMVELRKAFKPKALLRLFMIFTSNIFNHDMWFRSNTIKQIASKFSSIPEFKTDVLIEPEIIESNLSTDNKFVDLVNILKMTDKKIIFINPPIGEKGIKKECNVLNHRSYEALSHKLSSKIYDYTCVAFDKKFLRDLTHLNSLGRSAFTQMLVRDLKSEIIEVL